MIAVVFAGGAVAVGPTDTITTFRTSEAGKTYQSLARWGTNRVLMGATDGPMVAQTIVAANASAPGGSPSNVGPIAVDWARGYLYFIPFQKHAVKRYMVDTAADLPSILTGNRLTTGNADASGFAGDGETGGNVNFNAPSALAVGPDGTLYIADTKNNKVRMMSTAGVVETLAGTGTSGSTGDGGQATSARLSQPNAVAVGPDNAVYIGSGSSIRKVTPNGVISTFVQSAASGLAFDAAGTLYVSRGNGIVKFLRGTTTPVDVVPQGFPGSGGDGGEAAAAGLRNPEGLVIDQQGSLYIVDKGNGRIRKIRNYPPRSALECRPSQGDAPLTVTCTPAAGAYDPNGKITTYAWKFSDLRGGGVTIVKRAQVTHTYRTTGTKTVKLTVTDDAGVRATAQVAVTVR